MPELWGVLLLAVAGFLVGGTIALWKVNRILGGLLAVAAVIAVVAGATRLGYV
ncbi:hypothetical protein J4H86_04750 [Spiractinospora alimapuensis]|uniref:hypothetical protein n=1 Tax=Spiractinospora alimapuensis TaxID=2820884 RepID=UPI001F1B7BD7|nr:hypothetical protein [Spiractinospora alimapuensis]QVQ53107.1 hypothetical protein J4H86_04750 [Spiractinospora alimapuensis]